MKPNLRKIKNSNILIIGAGAAGGNCLVHLAEGLSKSMSADELIRHISWVSTSFRWGTSRMSGSDKQTYYKLGTSAEITNSATDFAQTLTDSGATHHDLALIEGINSLREFYHLVQLGVPFPEDDFGVFVGYKTDNDPYQSATSAGPLTSKYMSQALEDRAREFNIDIRDGYEFIDMYRHNDLWVALFIDRNRTGIGELDIIAIVCRYLIVATGGPGMLFETSVYPPHQISSHGILFRAGAYGENLSEWQFGLASVKPAWNVSGSYMQAIPCIYSKEPNKDYEIDFLADYFDDPYKAASMIFMKGYQWPFDVQHAENSSKIDLAVLSQQQAGRQIYLDFTRNPFGLENEFEIDKLDKEAREYLIGRNANHQLPIDRLRAINPPAIEFYKNKGIDLTVKPLEIALCAQHNNGGIAVDINWQSNLENLFVIGELAGTHGVRRPGGSALNSGQVGGLRAAKYILKHFQNIDADNMIDTKIIMRIIKAWESKTEGTVNPLEAISVIRKTMDSVAGIIRKQENISEALKNLSGIYHNVKTTGWHVSDSKEFLRACQAENLLISAITYLHNMLSYIKAQGGSRGSALIEREGAFVPENISLRNVVFRTKFCSEQKELCITEQIPVRKVKYESPSFEKIYLKQLKHYGGKL